jgi:hypothetical protein
MNLDDFTLCVEYILFFKYNDTYSTPDNATINAVRNYNLIRAQEAKNIATFINQNDFLDRIRRSDGVRQLNKSPPNTLCIVSNEKLQMDIGKTIIINKNNINTPYCIHQRYLKHINNYFCIMHFDSEILKIYGDFMKKHDKISNGNNIKSFIGYNNLSNIKRLLIKFNGICEN